MKTLQQNISIRSGVGDGGGCNGVYVGCYDGYGGYAGGGIGG